jgi:methionine-gamma-lyase
MLLGPTMDPKAAFNISMRLPHLGLRMAEHSRRALAFATRLSELKLDVTYPGLPDHPDHEILARQSNPEFGFGGLFCLDLGDTATANHFMETLQNEQRFGFMAVSLGYFETLMSCSASSTSSELSEADQKKAGIRPGLVRISIGYTGSLEQRWPAAETPASSTSGPLWCSSRGKRTSWSARARCARRAASRRSSSRRPRDTP